ncbi:MAG TPA: phosphotriesterase-related protein, partial [Candidatus Avamphibacillus sp.]|nr:phosphotriesterase-related protein [Candidatus Avamphibacillus sp.]
KIGFDRFGIQGLVGAPMDEERIATLLQLLDNGYEEQIMLSHDSINYWMGRPPVMNDKLAALVKNWHPTHVFENIIPELIRSGVPEKTLEKLFRL